METACDVKCHLVMQGSYFNLTLEWLVKHAYPPGPIHLTRTHLPTLPLYYSVGKLQGDTSPIATPAPSMQYVESLVPRDDSRVSLSACPG